MVQEERPIDLKVARLERRIKDLERIMTLGLSSPALDTVQAQVNRHTAMLGRLTGDAVLGNILLGPFPGVDSSQSLRAPGADYYLAGTKDHRVITANIGMTTNLMFGCPFYAPGAPNRIDDLAIFVTTAPGSTKVRLGIYDTGEDLKPKRLLVDAGEQTITTTGEKNFPIDLSFARGLVWLTFLSDSPFISMRALQGSTSGAWNILGQSVASNIGKMGWTVFFTYAALPPTWPSTTPGTTETIPAIYASLKAGGWS